MAEAINENNSYLGDGAMEVMVLGFIFGSVCWYRWVGQGGVTCEGRRDRD